MGMDSWRNYQMNPREFDGWLNANAVLGSVVAIAILGAAFASFFSSGTPNGATEIASVNQVSH